MSELALNDAIAIYKETSPKIVAWRRWQYPKYPKSSQ